MQFLNRIPIEACHPEAVSLAPGPRIVCQACRKDLMGNVYQYIAQDHPDYFRSSELAQAYHAWTGDDRVPLNFPLVDLEGILTVVVRGQSLARVRKSIRLLRALNAPFTTRPEVPPLEKGFLMDFLNIIHEHPNAESANERMLLDALLRSMHDMLSQKDAMDPFDTYFDLLVPYAQKSLEGWKPLPATEEDPNAAKELLFQLVRSSSVRQTFGRYAIPFDVLHVMVACYACSSNMNVVGNWALDFLARICRGRFHWQNFADSPFVVAVMRLIERHVSYKKNVEYYRVLQAFRSGDSSDHYSVILEPFHQVQRYLKERYAVAGVPSGDVLDLGFSYAFPAVLFRDPADQLGFTMGYNHILMTMNRKNGELPKGTYKSAKKTHETVKRFVGQIRQFDREGLPWTIDTVKLFLATDQNLERDIMEVVKTIVEEE